ncbi:MAG: BamA/TamA family outer membrane protein [Candidatus Latescibacteria bacterium]|nr:BamA/TamA family outer membrane protein [Candidatus Latescibacterota bacterium]
MKLHSTFAAIATGILLGALLPATASAQYFGRNKIQYNDYTWHVLSTPHFDIHYYEGAEAFAVRAALVLEDGYEEYTYKLKVVLPWKVPVILYSNHADFLETNVTSGQLSEGVQAFAEPSRRRIVLPFTSSFKEFRHTAIHELAHVFTFHIVYNRMLDNVFTRNYLFAMPLWVAEGLAEYLAEGWDADADMFIRDAVIQDYLYPFHLISGFYVYKEGQSVFNYIADTYGHEKVLEILNALAGTRSAEAALQRTLGLNQDQLYEQWSKALRKHYWPLYPDKQELDDVGRRLTDHIRDRAYYNTKPVLSPDGEHIVFFSDRSGMIEVRVISALDGTEVSNVVTDSRTNKYESLHLLTSSVCFDPTGTYVAFVAKSKGHDALFVRNFRTAEERTYEIDSNGLTSPAWHPTRNEIVVSGTFHGQTDLVLINLDDGTTQRLTNDPADQLTPRFYPDGNKLVFVYYPEITIPVPANFEGNNRTALSEMDFLDPANVNDEADYDIYEFDLATGKQRPIVRSRGDDTEPIVLSDGKTLIYASDESGVNNLHAGNIQTGETYRFTDVLGGLFTPTVHEEKGRIAYSAFVKGGWDIYVSDDLQTMLGRKYAEPARRVLAHDPKVAAKDLEVSQKAAEAEAATDSTQAAERPAAVEEGVAVADSTSPTITGMIGETVAAESDSTGSQPDEIDLNDYQPAIRPLDPPQPAEPKESPIGVRPRLEGVNAPVGADEAVFRGATVNKYHTKLAPDFIGSGGGLYFSSGFGFGLSNSVALSDMLGDHHLMFAFSLYQDIANSDVLVAYTYLKRRVDFSFGAYQFSGYYDSRVSSVGETFSTNQLFSERNYGIFGLMSVPFNKFYRMELDLQAYYSDREFFQDIDPTVDFQYTTVEKSKVRLIEPSLAFVHDSSFYGPFGPVDGSRWRISLARGVAFEEADVSRTTGYVDWRWYRTLFWRNSLALRFSGAASVGEDPRVFFLGGPTRLRGYEWDEIEGSRMWYGSFEYRFPLIDALILGWPGRWGFTNIGATAFFDVGAAWNRGIPDLFVDDRLDQAYSDIGFGLYMYAGYFLLSFQFAWPTDVSTINDDMKFHFYMGPTF